MGKGIVSSYLPEHLLKLPEVELSQRLLSYSALDCQVLQAGEMIRCWRCYRSSMSRYNRTLYCVGAGACHTHYLLFPYEVPLLPDRTRCPCGCVTWQLKQHETRCSRCKIIQPLLPRVSQLVALLDEDERRSWRDLGYLKLEGGPSWHRASITEPLKPRVDLDPYKLKKRLQFYRWQEDQKRELGRDPAKDYRKLREVW